MTEAIPEEYCTELRCTCGPPPKRPRSRYRRISILDLLEIDLCRRAILKYLPLNDILRSERVCRRWRDALQYYLRGAHRLRCKLYITAPWHPAPARAVPGTRALPLDESRDPWFHSALYKWGKAVDAAPCTADSFQHIMAECPNIQELTFYGMPARDILRDNIDKLRQIKRIAFRNLCTDSGEREQATDADVEIFLKNCTIEELTIIGNDQFTGICFEHLKNNLKALRIRNCPSLHHCYVLNIRSYMREMTTLELSRNSPDILKHVHILLDLTDKLENLELCGYDKMELRGHLKTHPRLASLQRLSLRRNRNVNDDWMETIALGSKLTHLDVSYCKGVTMSGLTEVCEASRSLSELCVANNDDITDEDVETIIRLCPDLTMLNIQKCSTVTSDLVVYLARLMRRRSRWRLPALRLRLYGTVVPETMPMIYSFILDFTKGTHCTAKPNPWLGW